MSRDLSSELVPVGDDLDVVEEGPTAEEISEQIVDATRDLARLTREAQEIATAPVDQGQSTALVPSNVSAAQAKVRLAKIRADVTRQQMALSDKQDAIRAKQREIENLMHEQMALAQEAIAPLEKFVARLEEGIWMVNLYLGRDEEILMLRDGEPADAREKVVIRQMVLAMDEECAINPEDDGIDSTNIEEFDEWLKADPAHVDQIAPEPKCVVALRPRFRSKQYEDPWKQQAVSEADQRTYFLIRNGEQVYRTWTEFNVGDRLVPNADEFTSYFYEEHYRWDDRGGGRDAIRVPIAPGTLAWEKAEEKADERKRHFMRVGLVLQGLVDRTTVFHPLPDGGVSFLDFEHNGKSWRFLLDAEMALTSGRQPFYEWLAEKNANLRVGMRIVGAFNSSSFRDRESDHGYRNYRLRPANAKRPKSGVLHLIEEQDGEQFVIRYERTEDVYDPKMWTPAEGRPGYGYRGGSRKPKRRASCLLFRDDRFILPFDLVTEQEMVEYLGARIERHAYADMFPLLKAAIRAKRVEAAEEAPFRKMLAGVLARDNGVEVGEAEADLDSLIDWFKLTNKNHRPLVGDERSQGHAVRMIVAEHARRLKAKLAAAPVVEKIVAEYPSALIVARKRDGRYVALVPESDENVFVAEHEFTARGVASGDPKRWRLMPSLARRSRWHVAFEADRFREWDFQATLDQHVTGPEYERMVETVMADRGDDAMAVAYDAEKHEFHTWRLAAGARIDREHLLSVRPGAPEVEHVERKWSRKSGEAVLRKESKSWRSEFTDQRKPWDSRSREGVKWYPRHENRYTVLWVDEALDGRYAAELERFEAADRERDALLKQARSLLSSIASAWVARKEADVYARFLEDFMDPELWEGHRKALPRDTFSYPHGHYHRHSFGSDADSLALLVEYAVEEGIDLDGLTVWEAASAHFPPTSWLRRRTGEEKPEETRDDIPEDVRELRFVYAVLEPEVEEPDDDDWNEG